MMEKSKTQQLFLTFLRIGAFTFGGGYAMIPMIQREIVENKKWLESKDLMDVVAIAETTPGPIAINAATFVGYKVKGIKGSLAATLGVVLPSLTVIMLVTLLFMRFMTAEVVANAFWGIRIAVLALMLKALLTMYKECPRNAVSYAAAAVALVCVAFFNVNVLFVIIASAAAGIVYQLIKAGKQHDNT